MEELSELLVVLADVIADMVVEVALLLGFTLMFEVLVCWASWQAVSESEANSRVKRAGFMAILE